MISDIDFVINTDVCIFVKKLANKNVKINKVNIHYKTISIILSNKEYQITSFRKDLITFGRKAYVGSTESIYQDAKRRDFTINALYLDQEGKLIDPLNGYEDITKRKLRFIDNPIGRIEEDYLRILRFCRFSANFPKNDIYRNYQKKITAKSKNICILSNKRMRDELTKIFMENFFYISLSTMVNLELDRYILSNVKIKKHEGFKTRDFKKIIFIKSFALNIIKNEKLDLICVIILHLYSLNMIEMIFQRFDLNKRKINFCNFVKQILDLEKKVEKTYVENISVKDKKINILKFMWFFRCKINTKNKNLFNEDRIPFNWYKLALFYIYPLKTIKEIDLYNLSWPKFPIKRSQIKKTFKQNNYDQINNLIFKAEEFWVNKNFKSSSDEILMFLKKI